MRWIAAKTINIMSVPSLEAGLGSGPAIRRFLLLTARSPLRKDPARHQSDVRIRRLRVQTHNLIQQSLLLEIQLLAESFLFVDLRRSFFQLSIAFNLNDGTIDSSMPARSLPIVWHNHPVASGTVHVLQPAVYPEGYLSDRPGSGALDSSL